MLVPAKITKNSPDSSRAGAVQFINLKSYDEDCLLCQCFYYQHNDNQNGYTNTGKTDLFRQRGFFFSLLWFLTGFLHGYWKWFPCQLSLPYCL